MDPSYSAALSLAIKFLEVQQSGTLPSWNRVRRAAAGGWRDNAHTLDGASIGKDLSGGYYDGAHSYKMTLPTAFLVNNLAAALGMYGEVGLPRGCRLQAAGRAAAAHQLQPAPDDQHLPCRRPLLPAARPARRSATSSGAWTGWSRRT